MPAAQRVIVLGGGGHAKVVLSALQEAGYAVSTIYDDDPNKWGTTLLGIPIVGPIASLEGRRDDWGVIALGDNATRKRLAQRWPLRWLTVVHPRALVHASVRIGCGTVIMAGAIIQPDAILGEHAIVNTSATVDHDCVVGSFAHLAPGVHLAGRVRIGEGTLLGVGSVVLPGGLVGAWATVGAGAVVTRALADKTVAQGVPARPIGSL